MIQNRNNQQQGNQQRGGNQSSRRVISLKSITEETVAGGAKRVLLQARVESGKRPFSGEPMTLTTTSPTGASVQFGAFIEAATQLAHWSVEIPPGQERVYQVTDGDGNISESVTVDMKAKRIVVRATPQPGGSYQLVVSVQTEDGVNVPNVPITIEYPGVNNGALATGGDGYCTHTVTISGSSVHVTVESPGLKSWSARLFSQVPTQTP